jgi:hypothetical protein
MARRSQGGAGFQPQLSTSPVREAEISKRRSSKRLLTAVPVIRDAKSCASPGKWGVNHILPHPRSVASRLRGARPFLKSPVLVQGVSNWLPSFIQEAFL